ncbi:MAG: metallophosphoesterase family protein [Bacteroidota bacterium]
MPRILILSDTHGHIDDVIMRYAQEADEIWHGGDIGTQAVSDRLKATGKPLRAVYGNIDGDVLRMEFPEFAAFEVAGLRILITHIAGRPGRYTPKLKEHLLMYKPDLLVCGHSHILLIEREPKSGMLHLNPGAAGISGFHQERTMVRLELEGGKIQQAEVIQLGKRSAKAIG